MTSSSRLDLPEAVVVEAEEEGSLEDVVEVRIAIGVVGLCEEDVGGEELAPTRTQR